MSRFFPTPRRKNSEKGIALMMVMSSIVLMTILLAQFKYDTLVNKLRIYGQSDRSVARYNAHAGLNMALIKLRMYQEARNLIEDKKELKDLIKPEQIQELIMTPFIYPVPMMAKRPTETAKRSLEEFNDSIKLDGQLSVNISAVSGMINPNGLRIPEPKNKSTDESTDSQKTEQEGQEIKVFETVEKQLVELLDQKIEEKGQKDDYFNTLYSNVDTQLLVKELKFYVNDKGKVQDAEMAQIEPLYDGENIQPKHAPLSSLSEMYLLLGWESDIVDLIIDQLTVHEATVLDVSQITDQQLKMLFPDITDQHLKDFFEYRDGNKEKELPPTPIKSVEKFKEVLTSTLGIVQTSVYDTQIKEFEKAGIKLGVASKLFKVLSIGSYNSSTFSLTAYVDLPMYELPLPKKNPNTTPTPVPFDDSENIPNEEGENQESKPSPDGTKEVPKVKYLRPRVVEIFVQ